MQLPKTKKSRNGQVKKLTDIEKLAASDVTLFLISRGDLIWPQWNGNAIHSFRTRFGFTQSELAAVLQVDQSTIVRWEKQGDELIPPLAQMAMTLIKRFWPDVDEVMIRSDGGTENDIKLENDVITDTEGYSDSSDIAQILMRDRIDRSTVSKERIIRLRKELSMSREEFAEFLDVSVSTINKWETGKAIPLGPANTLLLLLEQDQIRSFGLEEKMHLLDKGFLNKKLDR